jgi:hypothetical protein
MQSNNNIQIVVFPKQNLLFILQSIYLYIYSKIMCLRMKILSLELPFLGRPKSPSTQFKIKQEFKI